MVDSIGLINYLSFLPLLILGLASFLVLKWQQRSRQQGRKAADVQDTDALVEARYDKLLSQVHLGFEVVGVAMIGYRVALWRDSKVQFNELALGSRAPDAWSHLWVLIYVMAVVATICVLHSITRSMKPRHRNMVYRCAFLASDSSFRLQRIVDILAAHDQRLFMRTAAEIMLYNYSKATTWSAFAGGVFIGIIQPPAQRYRYLFLFVCLVLPCIPPGLGFALTGDSFWLCAILREISVPYVIGYLVESVQRRLINQLLAHAVRNEQALSLPSALTHAGSSGSSAGVSELSLDDFVPVGILGFGSTAQVRLMRSRNRRDLDSAGELRAVKSVFKVRNGVALNSDRVKRVLEEKEILLAAHDHPFVVRLFATFEDEHCYHFVLEYATNGPLSLRLTAPLPERTARLVAAEVVAALLHLHTLGVVYRDLKPENVLVLANGHVVLADFGVSKRLRDGSQTGTREARSVVGTPGYLAPEVLQQHFAPPDAPMGYKFEPDFWALGILLHVMLIGEEPMQVHTIVELLKAPESEDAGVTLRERVSTLLSPEARSLLLALLVLDPRRRLGAKHGAKEVQAHPYFQMIDWEQLLLLALEPPFSDLSCISDAG